MNKLKEVLQRLRPEFNKGGKYEKFRSTFDALDTFLFVPGHTTHGGTHIKDGIDLKRTMFMVVISMIPALLFGIWNVGYQHFRALGIESTLLENMIEGSIVVLPIVAVSYMVGLGIEFAFAQIRGHQVNEGFLVTGMLIPLCLPPSIPLWMVGVATAFTVVVCKEVFGGTGMNLLNPALTARVFLFFAYPAYMAGEYLSNGDFLWVSANRSEAIEGFSGATSLSLYGEKKAPVASLWEMFVGLEQGSIGETSVLAILIGALILIITGIGSWRIIVSVFVGGFVMGLILNAINAGLPIKEQSIYMAANPLSHLLMGGFAFGAVYMATDPVSAAQTNLGKIYYGFLIGVFTVMLRVWNPAYPEGMMLAILFMNVLAPLVDYFVIESNKKRRLARVK
ncbi:MAG: NADH:ubiquinone reductase (Na(+)-transporting) subunit B [Bacteroidota bacterium]|nr:NADH:ubiquinone reductase (Na(+)-transporting) subunit B [Bacteroidota bacterium]